MVARYFAYGSNMNPERVRSRGLAFAHASPASLDGFVLTFDKTSAAHEGSGHANIAYAPGGRVEGVLYWLSATDEIRRMDRFESTPVNYSREIVRVRVLHDHLPPLEVTDAIAAGSSGEGEVMIPTWTYVANPAVRRAGLLPPRSYLEHLLAGRPFLSGSYVDMLEAWPCEEDR
ncbi:MAG: gamma-glutamylcyclotransferase family protein [Pseudomonadales bacterium]